MLLMLALLYSAGDSAQLLPIILQRLALHCICIRGLRSKCIQSVRFFNAQKEVTASVMIPECLRMFIAQRRAPLVCMQLVQEDVGPLLPQVCAGFPNDPGTDSSFV